MVKGLGQALDGHALGRGHVAGAGVRGSALLLHAWVAHDRDGAIGREVADDASPAAARLRGADAELEDVAVGANHAAGAAWGRREALGRHRRFFSVGRRGAFAPRSTITVSLLCAYFFPSSKS